MARRSAALTLALVLAACRGQSAPPASFAEARRGDLVFTSSFYGELEARKRIAIHTPDLVGVRSLTIDTILPDGTRVKKGDVVITFVKGPLADELRDLIRDAGWTVEDRAEGSLVKPLDETADSQA